MVFIKTSFDNRNQKCCANGYTGHKNIRRKARRSFYAITKTANQNKKQPE